MNTSIKPKNCKECGAEFIPFRTFDKFCSYDCKKTEKRPALKRAALKHYSTKRRMQLSEYSEKRLKYLKKTPKCERCNNSASEIHHMAGRINHLLNDESNFMAICRPCHRWIHENPKQARAQGWLK